MNDPITTVNYHAGTGDTFDVEIIPDVPLYAVVKIRNLCISPVTIFTPGGRNWTRDYLVELRDELNYAIDKLDAMETKEEE